MGEVTKRACPDCETVTRAECVARHMLLDESMEECCERLDKKDVQDARNEGRLEVQTKLLWGIFGIGAAQFFVNIFTMYVPK